MLHLRIMHCLGNWQMIAVARAFARVNFGFSLIPLESFYFFRDQQPFLLLVLLIQGTIYLCAKILAKFVQQLLREEVPSSRHTRLYTNFHLYNISLKFSRVSLQRTSTFCCKGGGAHNEIPNSHLRPSPILYLPIHYYIINIKIDVFH